MNLKLSLYISKAINEKNLSIRTFIVDIELKNGMFYWIMNHSGEINVYTETYWSGVTTLELAKEIQYIIKPITKLNALANLYNYQ